MKKWIFVVMPLLFAGCVSNQPSNVNTTPQQVKVDKYKELEQRLAAVENRVSQIEAKTVENGARIKTLNERVARIEDRLVSDEKDIYDLKKKVEKAEKVINEITVSLNATEQKEETGTKEQPLPIVEQPSQEVQTPEVVNVSDEDIYKKAFNAMETGELDTAKILFETLVKRYPDSPLADNALYWIGEIFYSHGDYATALNYFKQVVDNYSKYYPSPKGNKVPAALLKEALCYKGLGDYAQAKKLLKTLISKYPSTNESAIAKVKLMELGD
ncbi:tol-pal system protein YbgF [Desulfurobacterium atlanticum]|uniref:Beta-barrel assembly machine subunit BamD n=1 Tax=Desulfurobacterium atlanticum TaxID=240169 RepID=A0A238Z8Z9_9BACT|nr:tol-pal system protein YbgF [Desulfurobacterium atlanticum]SNR79956.1 Beta-barrel assembly machine subunit BamD [Desulfurobacterium atlanticum]